MTMISIRGPRDDDRPEWLRMRLTLWDDCPVPEQEREMDEYLGEPVNRVFLAERPEGGLCGFLEASIHPWAVGCEHRPVGYIEGWYVDADVGNGAWAGPWWRPPRHGPAPRAACRWPRTHRSKT